MTRQGPVLLAAAVLVLAGAALFAIFGGGGTAPLPIGTDDGPASTTLAPDPAPVEAGEGPLTDPGGAVETRRAAVVDAAAATRDPLIDAAMAGFRGRVVDTAGTPVPDTLVQMFRIAPDSVFNPGIGVLIDDKTAEPDIDAGEQRTAADGRFELTGVWPRGFYLLKAGVDSDSPTTRFVQSTPGPGEIIDLGDIRLNDTGTLVGTVVDDAGAPIAGAVVRAVDIPGTLLAMMPVERIDPEGAFIVTEDARLVLQLPAWVKRRFEQLPIPRTTTAADGAFRLCGVEPGTNFVAVTFAGLLPTIKDGVLVKAGKEKDLGQLRLREGETVTGRVVDGENKPIVGAEVVIASESATAPVHFGSYAEPTDAEGRFRLGGFPSRNVIAAARRGKSDPWLIAEPQPATRELTLRLSSTHTATLTLVSKAGLPIEAPRFQLTPGRRDRGGVEMAMWGAVRPLDLETRVARLGDGRFAVRDLPKGTYVLLVESQGHAVAGTDLDVQGDVAKTIELGPRVVFEVSVTDWNGQPVRNAAVYAEARGDRPRMPDMPIRVGTTDAAGTVEVDGLHCSEARVSAQHPAHGVAHGEVQLPSPRPVQLRFAEPGSIEGVLTEGGKPPELAKWMIAAAPNLPDRGAMPDMPRIVTPDVEGRFALKALQPGQYRLTIAKSVDHLTSPGKFMQFATQMFMAEDMPARDVDVIAGQTVRVDLDALDREIETGPSAHVGGTVIIDGRPGKGLVVTGWGEGKRKVSEVDAAGRFDLGQVKEGHLYLSVMEKPDEVLFGGRFSGELWDQQVQVEAGKDLELSIEFSTSRLEGTVSRADGSAAAGCWVWINAEFKKADGGSNHVNFHAETDSQGKFVFPRVPAATYSLQTSDRKDRGKGKLDGVVVEAGIPTTGITVVMRDVVKVRGIVDLAVLGDNRPEWMWLGFRRVTTDGGQDHDMSWASIEDGNRFEANDLLPGTYEVQLHVPGNESGRLVAADKVVVGEADLDNVALRIVREAPPQPKPQGSK